MPTAFLAPGDDPVHPFRGPVVVKPGVSACSLGTAVLRPGDGGAADHVRRLHADGRAAMVQPRVAAVDTAGEPGPVIIAGRG